MRSRLFPEITVVALMVPAFLFTGVIRTAFIALIVMLLGAFATFAHRNLVHLGFATALGLLPFGAVPGTGLSILVPMIALMWIDSLVNGRELPRISGIEWWTIGLILSSLVSVVVVRVGPQDFGQFINWFIATSVIFPLCRLNADELARIGRYFVKAVTAATLLGFAVLVPAASSVLVKVAGPLGYDGSAEKVYVGGSEGASARLTATFSHPNGAGIYIFIALILCMALFSGRIRNAVALILLLGLAMTLSRAAIGAVVVSSFLLITISPMGLSQRVRSVSLIAIGLVGALMTPVINSRFADSFGSKDVGSQDRLDGLKAFPDSVSGHWIFGLGWGRPEFLDLATGLQVNYIANAPLLAIYRGGLVVGFFFAALVIVACAISFAAVLKPSWPGAVIGAGFIGFCLVTIQLDFPVITLYPITTVFAFFMAYVVRSPDFPDLSERNLNHETLSRT